MYNLDSKVSTEVNEAQEASAKSYQTQKCGSSFVLLSFEECVRGSLGVMSPPPHPFATTWVLANWVLVGPQQATNE